MVTISRSKNVSLDESSFFCSGFDGLEESRGPIERGVFSTRELIGIFPQAKSAIKELVKEDTRVVEEHKELKNNISNELFGRVKMNDLETYTALVFAVVRKDWLPHREWVSDRLDRNRKLLSLFPNPKQGRDSSFEDKLNRARNYPIENLVKVNGRGWAKCQFHSEKTASFQINRQKNVWYCFSCSEGGDAISLFMKLNNVKFKEAVEKLCL